MTNRLKLGNDNCKYSHPKYSLFFKLQEEDPFEFSDDDFAKRPSKKEAHPTCFTTLGKTLASVRSNVDLSYFGDCFSLLAGFSQK